MGIDLEKCSTECINPLVSSVDRSQSEHTVKDLLRCTRHENLVGRFVPVDRQRATRQVHHLQYKKSQDKHHYKQHV